MNRKSVVALSGGIGGAKLSLGLLHILPPRKLSVIVNTGDDFQHLGLYITPDIDTTLYTLAGLANPETGWGLRDETWSFMEAQRRRGGTTWFKLGDRDLEMHAERTWRLGCGETLSAVTSHFARSLGIDANILPMSDDTVRTRVATPEGELDFQDYFVRQQCRPQVTALHYAGAAAAQLSPAAVAALTSPDLAAIIICPSNPWLSIGPLLALPGMGELLQDSGAPVIAVSPLIGGCAVKGPTAKIMAELGLPVSAAQVAAHYANWIDGYVLDRRDAHDVDHIAVPTLITDTLMQTLADRQRLASESLAFAATLARSEAILR